VKRVRAVAAALLGALSALPGEIGIKGKYPRRVSEFVCASARARERGWRYRRRPIDSLKVVSLP
jgi:hypothetical protein